MAEGKKGGERQGKEWQGREGKEKGHCTHVSTVCTHQCACAVQEVSLGVVAVKTLFHEPSCVALVQLGGPGVVLHSQCTLTQLWESVEKGGRGGSGDRRWEGNREVKKRQRGEE